MSLHWILLVVFHMTVLIHTGNSCTVQIESDKDFVKLGGTANLNCTSNCTGVVWKTRLTKLFTNGSDYFATTTVLVSDWADSPIKCMTESDGQEYRAEFNVHPYVLPSNVEIKLKEKLEEDKEHEVTCSVHGVAPVNRVTLSVIRGEEIFLSRTYTGDTRNESQDLMETFRFTARRSDHKQDFACQVNLNLTRVTNTTVQSPSVTVRTFALPESPVITAETWVEHGTETDISCKAPNAFPQENVTMDLKIDTFSNTFVEGNVSVSSVLRTRDLALAEYNVTCITQVLGSSKISKKLIYIYEPPQVNLTVPRKVVNLGDVVPVDCSLTQGNWEYFGLSIYVDGVLFNPTIRSSNLAVNVSIRDRKPTMSVTCELFIHENKKVLLTSEETVTVHYPPGLPTVNILTTSISTGDFVNLTCHSDAQPSPTYEWTIPLNAQVDFSQDKRSITIRQATSYHNGSYTCHAKNIYGESSSYQHLEVKGDNITFWVIVGVIAFILAALLIGFSSYVVLKNGKKGFYDLVRRKPKNVTNLEIPLQENSSV